ncbi:MAG: hypothetical protein JJ992_26375, partial [Planctomycetes bacterium]|nr:hypothetical protein [Planctomycetota bacterium]
VTVDSNNDVFVAGYITRPNGDVDWCIKKYGSDGTEDTTNWNIMIDYGADDLSWGVDVDSAGNVYAGGRLLYADFEWSVIQLDPGGAETFRDVIANTGNDWCRAVVVDSMDYVYGVGVIYRTDSGSDWYIQKYQM